MKGILYPLEVVEFKLHNTISDGSYVKLKVDVDFIRSMTQSSAREFFNEMLKDYNLMCISDQVWYIVRTQRPVCDWYDVLRDDRGLSEEIFMRVERL